MYYLKKKKKKKRRKQERSKTKNSKKKKRLVSETSSYVPNKAYNFSKTSSDFNINNIQDSSELSNRQINLDTGNTDTPYRINSSSINTSDINLVSVDSVNGRRYL